MHSQILQFHYARANVLATFVQLTDPSRSNNNRYYSTNAKCLQIHRSVAAPLSVFIAGNLLLSSKVLHYIRSPHFHIISTLPQSGIPQHTLFYEAKLMALVSCFTLTRSTRVSVSPTFQVTPNLLAIPRFLPSFWARAPTLRQRCREFVTQGNPSVQDLDSFLQNACKAKTRKTKLISHYFPSYHFKCFQRSRIIPQTYKFTAKQGTTVPKHAKMTLMVSNYI